jgi:Sulfotransferase family
MTLPNFFIIGAPKAGTTTLNFVLDQHREVFMCPVKETGFFWAYNQNIRLEGIGSEKLLNRLVKDLNEYQGLFRRVTDQKAIGESSVRYLSSQQTPGLIHRFVPDARLIVSLRQPAERAFSAFAHNLRDGLEPCSDFAQAIDQDRGGVRDGWLFCRYLANGFYYRAIKRYLEYFDISQLHISLLEDLIQEPTSLMKDIFRFLGVDDSFPPDLSHKHNVSGVIRNPVKRTLWRRSNRLRVALRPFLPPKMRHSAFEWVIRDLDKLKIPPDQRKELTEYYRQDILQLQDLIQRDLSHWLE